MKETAIIDLVKTITIGVSVFVLGQMINRFFLDPVSDLRKSVGNAKFIIIYRANYYCNPGDGKEENSVVLDKLREQRDKTSLELRKSASQLFAAVDSVKGYSLFYLLNLIPSKAKLKDAAGFMIGLSNSIHKGNCQMNVAQKEKCERALNSYKWFTDMTE